VLRGFGARMATFDGIASYPACVERVLTAAAEMPAASRSLATALPWGALARGLCRVPQRRSLLDAVSDTCDPYATAHRDLIPRWTYFRRSALVFARPVRVVKRELGSCRHMHSIVRIRLPPALDEEDWRAHQR
jgi:hypothetical protein